MQRAYEKPVWRVMHAERVASRRDRDHRSGAANDCVRVTQVKVGARESNADKSFDVCGRSRREPARLSKSHLSPGSSCTIGFLRRTI